MTIKEVSEKFSITPDTLRYYEKIGIIPSVNRTAGGIRDYTEEDLKWVELAKCMREAGVSVDTLSKYIRLFQEGDETIKARLDLLKNEQKTISERKMKLDETLERINFKISRYELALQTGKLTWDKEN